MASESTVPLLVMGSIISDCAWSFLTKWQDKMCVENCGLGSKLPPKYFEQPVWQTLNMFMGEMLCFLPVIIAKLTKPKKVLPMLVEEDETPKEAFGKPMRGWTICWLWLPALCDLIKTTLLGVGLMYATWLFTSPTCLLPNPSGNSHTPISIYQMTCGTLVLWVGVLSVILLRTRLFAFQWLSIFTVMLGFGLVGVSWLLVSTGKDLEEAGVNAVESGPELVMGTLLILLAQLFSAIQYVLQERIMRTYTIEVMLAASYEGFFGTLTILLALPILDAFPFIPLTIFPPLSELTSPVLLASTLLAFLVVASNYFNLTLTRRVSATARSTFEACQTLGIWAGSLALGWERVVWPGSVPQLIGFVILVYGTFLFNGLVRPPSFMRPTEVLEAPLIYSATTDIDSSLEVSLLEDERRHLLATQESA